MKKRQTRVVRKTKETSIDLALTIDGSGKYAVRTGIPFLDHMLSLFAKHGLFDLVIKAQGDLEVDNHHTNEDVGISLGEAFKKALGDKKSIKRFGVATVPMDEALVEVVVDIGGRPSLNVSGQERINLKLEEGYHFSYAEQFLKAVVDNCGLNLHVDIKKGEDFHHIIEALFKALGRALDEATQVDPRIKGVPSTKGRI